MNRELAAVLGVVSLLVIVQLARCDLTSSFSFHPQRTSAAAREPECAVDAGQ